MSEAEQLALKLVDWVSTVTQLDAEKGLLPNAEDWRRNAEVLFGQLLAEISTLKIQLQGAELEGKNWRAAAVRTGQELAEARADIAEKREGILLIKRMLERPDVQAHTDALEFIHRPERSKT